MAVLSVTEEQVQGDFDLGTEEASAHRFFTVLFDTNDDPKVRAILAAFANDGTNYIPPRFSTHPGTGYLYVHHVRPRAKSPTVYVVEVVYTTRPTGGGSDSQPDPYSNPLDQPPEISVGFAVSAEAVDDDIHGKAMLNSADEKWDPSLTKEYADTVIRIVRNQASFNMITASRYMNSVNSCVFYGFGAGMVRCTDFSGEVMWWAGGWYWRATYEFTVRTQGSGWKIRVMDAGFREKTGELDDDGKPEYENIKDKDGKKVTEPMNLDGNGKRLADGADEVWHEYEMYPLENFSILGI